MKLCYVMMSLAIFWKGWDLKKGCFQLVSDFQPKGDQKGAMDQLASAAASVGIDSDESSPQNLKTSDPKLSKRDIKVPDVGEEDEVKNPEADMEAEMMKLIMSAAISGILGPVFKGIGDGVTAGLFGP